LCECFHTYLYVNPFEVVTKRAIKIEFAAHFSMP